MFDASNNGFFLMNLNLFTKKIIAKKKESKRISKDINATLIFDPRTYKKQNLWQEHLKPNR